MICPRCETPTLISHQRGGMEVDVCSTCNGVWLDRGELERLSLTPPAPASKAMVDDVDGVRAEDHRSEDDHKSERRDDEGRNRDKDRDRDRDRDKDRDRDRERDKKKRPKSLGSRVADALDDVFDDLFDDIFD